MTELSSTPLSATHDKGLHRERPVGIIDIGSNTCRFVVFDGAARNPISLFNEKVSARLGQHVATTGELDKEGIARALTAFERFRVVADGLQVDHLDIIATAAVREAQNGPNFVTRVQELFGTPVRILSGQEEARYSALGVQSAIPEAAGLVGDLGGGSLELISINNGQLGQADTLPVGSLRLMDISGGKLRKARDFVMDQLRSYDWLKNMDTDTFYAVGGTWRTFGAIHQRQTRYPMKVLQHHTMSAEHALQLAKLLSKQSSKTLAGISRIPSYRVDSLPYGAMVLECVLKETKVNKLVISASGIREGLLFDGLPAKVKERDALLRSSEGLGRRMSFEIKIAKELMVFSAPLFQVYEGGEDSFEQRLREAACWLSDIGWRAHPDHRGSSAFREVLYGPVAGINHKQRVELATSLYYRYEAKVPQNQKHIYKLISESSARRAAIVGLTLRLGTKLASGVVGILPHVTLHIEQQRLMLTVPAKYEKLVGESVMSRLSVLAKKLKLQPALKVV